MNESSLPTQFNRRYSIRIKPVGVLIILVFLLVINAIAVISYQFGIEVIHVNVLFYMYFYFWFTFFLIATQIAKIINSQKSVTSHMNKNSK